MRIINAVSNGFLIKEFRVLPGNAWAIYGTNRSGIDIFFKIISGTAKEMTADSFEIPEDMGIISFKKQQEIYEQELKKDDTDFMDRLDPGTTAGLFLHEVEKHQDLIEAFEMSQCLSLGYRQLSSGQVRKLMLLELILSGASCLIIESPYEGLDPVSCRELDLAFSYLVRQKIRLVIMVNNKADIPSWCTHVAVVDGNTLDCEGPRDEMMQVLASDKKDHDPDFSPDIKVFSEQKSPGETGAERLVHLKNGFAGYNGQTVFKGLDLTIERGDHTLVTGPNGSGKSTLLQLICGDHPQCYINDLKIFGIQRGSGESIWDLKKKMGIVSPDLHRNYYVPGTSLHCIISGFFDSIGLYRPFQEIQEKKARDMLRRIGLGDQSHTPFRDLSYAEQRLVLIGRALIKAPGLLILDEVTQGLDDLNRNALMDFLSEVARENLSTILFVTHRQDEFRPFFRQHIHLP